MLTKEDETTAREFIEGISDLGPIVQVREIRRLMSGNPRLIQAVAIQRWYTATWPRYEAACKALGRDPFDPVLPDAE